jgi:polysaccharide export outer membrane protein
MNLRKMMSLMLLSACALPLIGNSQQKSEQPASADSAAPIVGTALPASSAYTVQAQDVLFLSFALTPELNQTVVVPSDGCVLLQSGNNVCILGKTISEVGAMIKASYAGILKDPLVGITLEDYVKPSFFVTGQVGKPGQYVMRTSTTVDQAIAIAGGLAPTAKTQVFLLRRVSADKYQVNQFRLKDLYHPGKTPKTDIVLKADDVVFVPEKFITNFRKYVPYSLNATASYYRQIMQ